MDVERYEKALWKAVRTLEEIRTDPSIYRDPEEERIRGKIEGVKLALSYLRDEKNAECGDWPSQCNCDDPAIHNGH